MKPIFNIIKVNAKYLLKWKQFWSRTTSAAIFYHFGSNLPAWDFLSFLSAGSTYAPADLVNNEQLCLSHNNHSVILSILVLHIHIIFIMDLNLLLLSIGTTLQIHESYDLDYICLPLVHNGTLPVS